MQLGDGVPDAAEGVSCLVPVFFFWGGKGGGGGRRDREHRLTRFSRFHDHQMITSRKDILGTELLSLPFRKEELEAILEDLVT